MPTQLISSSSLGPGLPVRTTSLDVLRRPEPQIVIFLIRTDMDSCGAVPVRKILGHKDKKYLHILQHATIGQVLPMRPRTCLRSSATPNKAQRPHKLCEAKRLGNPRNTVPSACLAPGASAGSGQRGTRPFSSPCLFENSRIPQGAGGI